MALVAGTAAAALEKHLARHSISTYATGLLPPNGSQNRIIDQHIMSRLALLGRRLASAMTARRCAEKASQHWPPAGPRPLQGRRGAGHAALARCQ